MYQRGHTLAWRKLQGDDHVQSSARRQGQRHALIHRRRGEKSAESKAHRDWRKGTHADRNADGHCYSHRDADRNRNSNRHRDGYCDADRNRNFDRDGDGYRERNRNSDCDRNFDRDLHQRNIDAYSDRHGHIRDSNRNGNCDRNRNADRNGHGCDSNRHAD
jgi:hypothetical protein